MAISAIKHTNNQGTSTATHNMYAARILKDGKMYEYSEDDGEHGGARHILQELQASNTVNRVVVVSRWYSGIQLGKKRFSIIAQCTKAAILKSQTTPTKAKTAAQVAERGDSGYTFASPTMISIPPADQFQSPMDIRHQIQTPMSTFSQCLPDMTHGNSLV
jgi:hypothetical protein